LPKPARRFAHRYYPLCVHVGEHLRTLAAELGTSPFATLRRLESRNAHLGWGIIMGMNRNPLIGRLTHVERQKMRFVLVWLFGLIAILLHSAIAIADAQRIDDPDKYANEVMALLSNNDVGAVSKKISDAVGKPSYAENLQGALSWLTGKKIDYTDKVIDNTFGKSLRQIVYYCFIENIGFVYFRFNFKMSSSGWILANFIFKTETNELFPKDFVDH
jgi:hypothetical protein